MVKCKNKYWYFVTVKNGKETYHPAEDEDHAKELNLAHHQDHRAARAQTKHILSLSPSEVAEYLDKMIVDFDEYFDNIIKERKRGSALWIKL